MSQQIGTSEQLLSIAEIKAAQKKIIKIGQSRTFAEEIRSLGSANNKKVAKVKQNNKLYSPDPLVDKDQVLCVGGRLKNSSLEKQLHSSYSATRECYCY